MAQYEMNLRDYWLIVRRRWLTIALATVMVAALSLLFARQRVPEYQATAAVRYEPSTSLSGLLVEVLSYSTADSIETQAALVTSTPILEEVARRLGRLPQGGRGEAVRESRAYAAALDGLAARIRTARVAGTSILEITARSPGAHEARELANTVAEAYRDYARATRNARITEARKFIEAQLGEVEARVRRAEEEMWAFREANRVISPGAESTVLLSLFTQVRGDIERTRQQRTELEQALDRLGRADPASVAERVYVDTANPAMQRLAATQTELLLERNNLALEVTDQHPRLQAVDDRLREIRREMRREVAAQVALLRSREGILGRQMGELLQKNREVPGIELTLQRLQRDVKVNDDLLALLKARHQEALIKESEGVEEVSLVRPASEPGMPAGGDVASTALLGALLGFLVGLGLAFVKETLDTSIGTIEDVESYLEVPVLGIVPHIDPRETMQRLLERRPALAQVDLEALQSHALLITHFDPKSPVAEAYRTLRTRVQFARLEHAGKTIVVTSPTLQEGKTTTIVNLALTMAQNGQRTLLVGANLRRPSIHRFFGIPREPGLSDILVGSVPWRDCIRSVADILMGRFEMEDIMAAPGLDNLHIIEGGPVPATPSELLASPAMGAFLRAVREEYDVVLIDTPPVLPVTDAAIVAGQVDGVILVYQAGKVGRLVLKRAKAHLESARGKVWGVVLNDLQPEFSGHSYAQYYTHYYGEEAPAEPVPGPARRALAFVRARLGRTSAGEPAGGTPERPGARRRLLTLVALGLALAAAAAALAVWQQGRSRPEPRDAIRERLERSPATAPAPETPGAPQRLPVPGPPASPTPEPRPGGDSAPRPVPPSPGRRTVAPGSRAPAVAPAASPLAPSDPAPAAAARFALEFGPFVAAADADRAQQQLAQAGFQTVRVRQQTGASLYAVRMERVRDAAEAAALVAALRERGLGDATAVATEPTTLQVGEAVPLRAAVERAERLRANGYRVRIAVQPGEAVTFVVRHGRFPTRAEAEAKSQELLALSLPNQVIRVP